MTKKELEKIILEFKHDNYDSFDLFYNETARGVYIFVYDILKNREKTEDVLQETYMRFIQTVDRYQKNTNVYNYLITIARNIAINIYNKEKRHINDNEMVNNIKEDENKEDLFFLLDYLDKLERQIVILHIFDKMKFREISDMLNMPLGTVLWQYNKAIKKLKKEVGN